MANLGDGFTRRILVDARVWPLTRRFAGDLSRRERRKKQDAYAAFAQSAAR
jgi:hypothetical protein